MEMVKLEKNTHNFLTIFKKGGWNYHSNYFVIPFTEKQLYRNYVATIKTKRSKISCH